MRAAKAAARQQEEAAEGGGGDADADFASAMRSKLAAKRKAMGVEPEKEEARGGAEPGQAPRGGRGGSGSEDDDEEDEEEEKGACVLGVPGCTGCWILRLLVMQVPEAS